MVPQGYKHPGKGTGLQTERRAEATVPGTHLATFGGDHSGGGDGAGGTCPREADGAVALARTPWDLTPRRGSAGLSIRAKVGNGDTCTREEELRAEAFVSVHAGGPLWMRAFEREEEPHFEARVLLPE